MTDKERANLLEKLEMHALFKMSVENDNARNCAPAKRQSYRRGAYIAKQIAEHIAKVRGYELGEAPK